MNPSPTYPSKEHDMNLEKPPFAPKQFVRIKSSGTILNVARCEKRVVHGALRWVVDDLNGMRAFAADCELIKNMELVNAETGQAVIHLEPKPEVRYACTKLAAVGDTVKYAGVPNSGHYKVIEFDDHGNARCESIDACAMVCVPICKLEFVPQLWPVGADFDFDEAANKAAQAVINKQSQGCRLLRDWISDAISAHIRPGVQALYAKLQHRRCDTCGANTIDGCMRCGAPQCCPQCCKIDDLTRQLGTMAVGHLDAADQSRERLAVAMSLLGQADNRLFLVGAVEIRRRDGGWWLNYPMSMPATPNDDKKFTNPVDAALRAKELADVGKVGA